MAVVSGESATIDQTSLSNAATQQQTTGDITMQPNIGTTYQGTLYRVGSNLELDYYQKY